MSPPESKSPAPPQKRREQTRQRLMEAGRRLFTRDGYHGTSSKKIAREAGIAVGSFYNHFDDKKDLLFQIHAEHVRKVHDLIATRLSEIDLATAARDGQTLVRAIIDQTEATHDLSPDLHREITALSFSDPDFMKNRRAEEERVVQVLVTLLEPHRARLRIDDLEAAARVVVQAVEEVIHNVTMFDPPIEKERLTRALADMIHRFLYRDDP